MIFRAIVVSSVLLLLFCSAHTGKPSTDPCVEAIRLQKIAEQSSSADRGILEAKAAAYRDICDRQIRKTQEVFDDHERRTIENKKKSH